MELSNFFNPYLVKHHPTLDGTNVGGTGGVLTAKTNALNLPSQPPIPNSAHVASAK